MVRAKMSSRRHLPAGERWGIMHEAALQKVRRTTLEPTRFGDLQTLDRLQLRPDVEALFQAIGLDRFFAQSHLMYPELVLEFLATCEIVYAEPGTRDPRHGTLTFFLRRVFHSISLDEFCDIYGFPHNPEGEIEPLEDPQSVWSIIGQGEYTPRAAKIALIRNPVLRIVAKILGTTFFCKHEPGQVTKVEMTLLYFGIRHLMPEVEGPETFDVNMGAVLAKLLVNVRGECSSRQKFVHFGSILTPLFEYVGADLENEEVDERRLVTDIPFLIRARILSSPSTYEFFIDGSPRSLQLPCIAHTALLSRESVEFRPPCDVGRSRPRRSVQQRPAQPMAETRPRRSLQERRAPPAAADPHPHYSGGSPPPQFEEREDATAEFDPSQYILGPMPPPEDELASRRWIMESTRTNNTMMHRMWSVLTRMTCFSGQSRRRARSPDTEEERVARAARTAADPATDDDE